MRRSGEAGGTIARLEGKALPASPKAEAAGALASARSGVRQLSAIPAILLAASIVAVLYDGYRYPLRINDSATSSTYRSTPLSLQAGKYAILGALALALIVVAIRNRRDLARLTRADLILLSLGSFALLRALAASVSTHSTLSVRTILPLVCGIPFALAGASWVHARAGRGAAFVRAAATFGAAVVLLHAATNVVEMGLWAAIGRLPALAYSHGLVRFGGVWDDPNSTAVFSALLITAVLGGALAGRRRLATVAVAAALFNLVVAWSFSGWLVFVVGVIGVGVPRLGWRKVVTGLAALAVAVAAIIGLAAVTGTDVGSAASTKLKSARSRLGLDHHLVHAHGVGSWLVGAARAPRVEDAFGTWLSATGVVGVVLLLVWLVVMLRWAVAWGPVWIFVGSLGLLAASLFVPLFLVFPVGFFFVILLAAGVNLPASDVAAGRVAGES
jgi:hypothetical protein